MAKKKIELDPIGTKAFAVLKSWVDKDQQAAGAKVIPCKLITYVNQNGKVMPIYQSLLKKGPEFTPENHYIYSELESAIKAIQGKSLVKDYLLHG